MTLSVGRVNKYVAALCWNYILQPIASFTFTMSLRMFHEITKFCQKYIYFCDEGFSNIIARATCPFWNMSTHHGLQSPWLELTASASTFWFNSINKKNSYVCNGEVSDWCFISQTFLFVNTITFSSSSFLIQQSKTLENTPSYRNSLWRLIILLPIFSTTFCPIMFCDLLPSAY